ncbi:MAG: hypothetical protein ACRDL3_07355 [Solirubrobacterales bacterium]
MPEGILEFELGLDHDAPAQVRDALEVALEEIDPGARLTAGLLGRAVAASCIRGDGGRIWIEPRVGADTVRVEVSGEGDGFRLPLSGRDIDYFSIDDSAAQPIGWRSYLLERLADDWGVDAEAGVAWFEVELSTATDELPARRLALRK